MLLRALLLALLGHLSLGSLPTHVVTFASEAEFEHQTQVGSGDRLLCRMPTCPGFRGMMLEDKAGH